MIYLSFSSQIAWQVKLEFLQSCVEALRYFYFYKWKNPSIYNNAQHFTITLLPHNAKWIFFLIISLTWIYRGFTWDIDSLFSYWECYVRMQKRFEPPSLFEPMVAVANHILISAWTSKSLQILDSLSKEFQLAPWSVFFFCISLHCCKQWTLAQTPLFS